MDAYITANRGAQSAATMGLFLNVTRNAVIGRSHRLKLEKLTRSPTGRPKQERKDRPSKVRKLPRLPEWVFEPIAPVEALNIPFVDLAPHHCRQIVGSEGIGHSLSCGHPVVRGSFCRWHGSINYGR